MGIFDGLAEALTTGLGEAIKARGVLVARGKNKFGGSISLEDQLRSGHYQR